MSPTSDVAMLRTVMQPIAFSWGSGHPNQNGFRTIENGQKNMKYLPLGPTNYSDMLFQPVSTATWMMCYDVANPAGYPRYDWHQEVCKTRTLRLARSYPQEERNRHGDAWGPFRSVWCLDINFHLGKKNNRNSLQGIGLDPLPQWQIRSHQYQPKHFQNESYLWEICPFLLLDARALDHVMWFPRIACFTVCYPNHDATTETQALGKISDVWPMPLSNWLLGIAWIQLSSPWLLSEEHHPPVKRVEVASSCCWWGFHYIGWQPVASHNVILSKIY